MNSKIGIVIGREYLTRVKKKSFIIMTLLGPLLFLGISILPAALAYWGGDDDQVVAIIDRTGLYEGVLESTEQYQFVSASKPLERYKSEGEESGVSGVLEIRADLIQDPKALTLFSFKTLPSGIEEYIDDKLSAYISRQKLLSHNIEGIEEIIESSKAHLELSTYKIGDDGSEQATSSTLSVILGVVLSMLSYMFISMYGGSVMQSVMEEKKSRIMEVMVSSVRPFQLMIGKIVGVGLVGLTQIAIWFVLIGIFLGVGQALLMPSMADMGSMASAAGGGIDGGVGGSFAANPDIQEFLAVLESVSFLEIGLCFALYFIGGFLLYAAIFAALGSAVSSEEDAQSIMWPVTVLMMVSFYVGFACLRSPESTLAQVASYIPFTSPVVMMIRIPYGVSLWEEALSLLVLYLSFGCLTYLGARIYRIGVLMYGKKPTLKEILRWMRA